MILLKAGAKVVPTVHILIAAADCFSAIGADCTITSGNDGTHMTGSKHYSDAALDFRIHLVLPAQHKLLAESIRAALGPDYFVLLESDGTPNEHIHVQYNEPKDKK